MPPASGKRRCQACCLARWQGCLPRRWQPKGCRRLYGLVDASISDPVTVIGRNSGSATIGRVEPAQHHDSLVQPNHRNDEIAIRPSEPKLVLRNAGSD